MFVGQDGRWIAAPRETIAYGIAAGTHSDVLYLYLYMYLSTGPG